MTSCPLVKTKTYDEQSSKNWQFLSPPLSTAFKDGAPSGHLGTTHTAMHLHIFTTRKRSLVQGDVFTRACHPVHRRRRGALASQYASQVTCSASKEGLPTGESAYRESGYRRVCLQGSVSRESAYRGSASRRSVYRSSAYRASASRGVCQQGGLHRGDWADPPPELGKWVEYFLVSYKFSCSSESY